jgi:hypothetical protein
VKQRAMMFAAVETVTKTYPVWASRRHDSDIAAQATAGEFNVSGHVVFPSAGVQYKNHELE